MKFSIYNQSKFTLDFYKNFWLFGLSLDKFKFGRRPQIFLNWFRVEYTISTNVRKQCFWFEVVLILSLCSRILKMKSLPHSLRKWLKILLQLWSWTQFVELLVVSMQRTFPNLRMIWTTSARRIWRFWWVGMELSNTESILVTLSRCLLLTQLSTQRRQGRSTECSRISSLQNIRSLKKILLRR